MGSRLILAKQHPDDFVSKYEFTTDWFSSRENLWQSQFGELASRVSNCLEIGSYEGRSAVWMLNHLLLNSESTLVCVDLFHDAEVESRFDRNIAATGAGDRVRKLKGFSWRLLRGLEPWTFDLAYIDGSHHGQCVLEDAVLCFRLLRCGGFLIFDDYPWRSDETHAVFPKDAIDAFLHLYQGQVDLLHLGWQVIIKKIGER